MTLSYRYISLHLNIIRLACLLVEFETPGREGQRLIQLVFSYVMAFNLYSLPLI
jgi:hypothetical protein